MMNRLLGAGLSAVIALGALLNPGEQKADPVDLFDVPAQAAEAPPAPQQQQEELPPLESIVVAKLSEMLDHIKAGDQDREQLAGRVSALGQEFAQFKHKVEDSKVTPDDVVKLVSTTLDEKAAQVKAQFGECVCNCDCDEKLAELTRQLEELKAKVAQLESAKVAASATSIGPGLSKEEVVQRLQAMGYQSRVSNPAPVVTYQSPPAIVDNRPGHWTYPGDINSHLNGNQHAQQLQAMGISTAGMTFEQMESLHDSLHEGAVVTAPVQYSAPVSNVRTRSRSVTRGSMSTCPTGGCPTGGCPTRPTLFRW